MTCEPTLWSDRMALIMPPSSDVIWEPVAESTGDHPVAKNRSAPGARSCTISSIAVYGGVPMDAQERALRAGVDIIVATPGRLMDHMRHDAPNFSALEVLVLDEADRMLDMGFWPDVQRILSALPISRQTLLFSATMPAEVLKLTQEFLRGPKYIQVGRRGGPAQTISHAVQTMASGEKTQWLARWLRDEAMGPVLIFCRTKIGAERLAQRLSTMGIRAASLTSLTHFANADEVASDSGFVAAVSNVAAPSEPAVFEESVSPREGDLAKALRMFKERHGLS
jgi:ATP-dependent RNA helicase RhlE